MTEKSGRGCLAGLLVPVAAVLLACSVGAGIEAESPELFPGLRANRSGLAVVLVALSVLACVGAIAAVWRASRGRLVAVGVVCGLLLTGSALRLHSVAPLMHCWGHGYVSADESGRYTCYDR
ncbi:hypothetical protein [Kitasatospora paracochleata]|uniref:Lipoprotein n=1 Tax=Kitasatospora paracochleata TaxID=58354 RepID=A0ABT1IQR1_9ACTN|nr:hypothetical protein [Kitasatospora paracochleata]MCP2307437.1 hypothetical protein [Kitasatospora paracochleata]